VIERWKGTFFHIIEEDERDIGDDEDLVSLLNEFKEESRNAFYLRSEEVFKAHIPSNFGHFLGLMHVHPTNDPPSEEDYLSKSSYRSLVLSIGTDNYTIYEIFGGMEGSKITKEF